MKIAVKTLAAIAGSVALIATLGACTSQSTDNSSHASGSFSYRLATQYGDWLKDLKWFPAAEKQSGVTVDIADGGDNDHYYQKLDLAMSSGSVQDAMVASYAQSQVYGKQGAFQDLAPLIKKYAPHIQKYLDANAQYRNLVTNADGQIFGLFTEQPKLSHVTFYRSDMYKAAGITPGQTVNIQQFTDQLQKLKDAYSSKVANYYPISGRDSYLKFLYAFGAEDRIADGKVQGEYSAGLGQNIFSPQFKTAIEWYRDIYSRGLIDPEWVNGSNTEDSWQEKMLTGKASVGDDFFTRPEWFMENGGPKNDPAYSMAVLPAFQTADGQQAKRDIAVYTTDRVVVVSAKSQKAEQVLKFLDYLFSEKGQTTMHYGVEGQSYKVVDGQPEYTVDFTKEGNKPVGTPAWNFLQERLTFPAPVDNTAYQKWMDPLTKSFAPAYFKNYVDVVPTLKYTADQLDKRSALQAVVDPYVTSQVAQFVQGKIGMDQWDAFLQQASAKGYKKIVAIDQAAYDASRK
jgi:putative aldouronate transport system substrate-binding protein